MKILTTPGAIAGALLAVSCGTQGQQDRAEVKEEMDKKKYLEEYGEGAVIEHAYLNSNDSEALKARPKVVLCGEFIYAERKVKATLFSGEYTEVDVVTGFLAETVVLGLRQEATKDAPLKFEFSDASHGGIWNLILAGAYHAEEGQKKYGFQKCITGINVTYNPAEKSGTIVPLAAYPRASAN